MRSIHKHAITIFSVTGGRDTGLKPRIADLVPGSWAQVQIYYTHSNVTGGWDSGLKPRIADLVLGYWAQVK